MRKLKLLNFRNICFVLTLIFLLFGNIQAQSTKVFSEANYMFDKWTFSIGTDKYEISKGGRGKRVNEKNIVTKFSLGLEGAIRRVVYFAQDKNDLLLLSETGDSEQRVGFIIRLNGKTLKTKWRADINGFNVANGLIEDSFAYLAAISFVAKIDLDTGNYVWKHEDFYRGYIEDGTLNIFETPKIEGNIITFTENQNSNRLPNKIKFNKTSGDTIEVKVN